MMRVLLGSGGFRTPERVAILQEQMRSFFGGVERLLFIPYALADHDGYVRILTEKGLPGGYTLDGIHRHADPRAAVEQAQAVYVGGGNTFRLLSELYRLDLLEAIRGAMATKHCHSIARAGGGLLLAAVQVRDFLAGTFAKTAATWLRDAPGPGRFFSRPINSQEWSTWSRGLTS